MRGSWSSAVRWCAATLVVVMCSCAQESQQTAAPPAADSVDSSSGSVAAAEPMATESSSSPPPAREVSGPPASETVEPAPASVTGLRGSNSFEPERVAVAGGGEPERPARMVTLPTVPTVRVEAPGGKQSGLEVRWWLADDTGGRVARALALYSGGESALGEAKAKRWELNGFRMVKVRVSDVAAVEEALTPIGPRNHVWVGWATKWTEVMRGRAVTDRRAVLVDGEPRALPGGTLRMIARSWGAAGAGRPELHVELAVQLHDAAKVIEQSDPFEMPTMHPEEEQGLVFRGLTVGRVMEDGWALVIVGEHPGVVWSRERAETDEQASGGAAVAPAFGPVVSGAQTLGEAMLSAEGFETGGPPGRAVVVLVPRVPGR